jgi:hypothetical protein
MFFVQGFIIWGIVVLVIAILAVVFWKFFLCTRTGYESKASVMAWGIGVMIATVATLLFIPLIMTQADDAIESVMNGLQKEVAENTKNFFKQNAKDELGKAFDQLLEAKGIEITPEIEQLKSSAVENAAKYAGNKSFRETIDTALKLFKINDEQILNVNINEISDIAFKAVEPYGNSIKKSEVEMTPMKVFFHNVLRTSSLSSVSGVENLELPKAATKAITNRLSKFFIIVSSILSVLLCVCIFVIILLLKEPKIEQDDLEERNFLFEFDRKNKVTGKKISEEINQYN